MFRRSLFISGLGCVAVLTISQAALAQVAQKDLRAYTEYALRNRHVDFMPPQFHWDNGDLTYFLGGVTDDLSLMGKPLGAALRQQYIATGIRYYRRQPRQRKFWKPVLERVEAEIAGMLQTAGRNDRNQTTVQDEIIHRQEEINSIYRNALDELAHKCGGHADGEMAYECASHAIRVSANPIGGELWRIGAGEWSFYIYFKDKTAIQMPPWESLPTGDMVCLYGKNWIWARWPDGRDWVKLVDVGNATSVTITPCGAQLN